jgi:prepilin-type processing-associated H-X9-DG protein
MMLPNMEQGALFNACNFFSYGNTGNAFWNSNNPINLTVQTTVINVFVCPSDLDRLTSAAGSTNYASNAGADAFSFSYNSAQTFSGPFYGVGNKAVKLSNIIDGTSNTVAFSEIVRGVGGSGGTYDNLKPSASPSKLSTATSGSNTTPANGNPQTDYTACKAQAPLTTNMSGGWALGEAWWWGRSGQTRYSHVMTPNTWSCDYGGNNSDSDQNAITASSRHSGGVNTLMMDGSVKFVKDSISPNIWWAISTMAGSEVVSANQY